MFPNNWGFVRGCGSGLIATKTFWCNKEWLGEVRSAFALLGWHELDLCGVVDPLERRPHCLASPVAQPAGRQALRGLRCLAHGRAQMPGPRSTAPLSMGLVKTPLAIRNGVYVTDTTGNTLKEGWPF
jgi:hypothetical protein